MNLFWAEVHRFRCRRFLLALALTATAVFALGVAVAAAQHHKTSAADRAVAQAQLEVARSEGELARQQCVAAQPPGTPLEQACPPNRFLQGDFNPGRPFVLAQQLPDGTVGVGGLAAAALFLLGATWIGAEWSTRSLVALLFWEPRRVKVLLVKLGVLLAAAAALAVVVQAAWFGSAQLLASTRGTRDNLPAQFYGDVFWAESRAVLFGVLLAGLGFALANLLRNTGAALGVAALYLAVFETAVRVLHPPWAEWLFTVNASALLSRTPIHLYVGGRNDQQSREIVLGHLHGGLYLVALVAGLLTLGGVLFARRDLQ